MAEQRQFSQTSLGQLQKARIKIWEKRSNRSKTYLRSNKRKKVGGNAKNQHFLQEILHAYFLSPDPTTNFKTKNLEFAQNCLKKTIRQFDKKKSKITRAAKIDFWQARMPQWQSIHQQTFTSAAVFYFSKSSKGPSLGCLVSRGGSAICKEFLTMNNKHDLNHKIH